jgi:hypothetical protein
VFLLSLTYFTSTPPGAAPLGDEAAQALRRAARPGGAAFPMARRVLLWVGGMALLPAMAIWTMATLQPGGVRHDPTPFLDGAGGADLPPGLRVVGWTVAIAGPLLLGWWLRGRRVWPLGLAVAWMLIGLAAQGPLVSSFTYGWNALGGLLLIGWGVQEARSERINMGTAVVALTLLTFYFSEVMNRLERSFSLIALGVLFLAGGWAMETLRRRLVRRARRLSDRVESP